MKNKAELRIAAEEEPGEHKYVVLRGTVTLSAKTGGGLAEVNGNSEEEADEEEEDEEREERSDGRKKFRREKGVSLPRDLRVKADGLFLLSLSFSSSFFKELDRRHFLGSRGFNRGRVPAPKG